MTQHTDEWARFESLSEQGKAEFFNLAEVKGINRYLDTDTDTLQFVIMRSAIVTHRG